MTVIAHPPAVVAKTDLVSHEQSYLQVQPGGGNAWVADPAVATEFVSLKEAMRMAMRLPAALRAFGVPQTPHAVH